MLLIARPIVVWPQSTRDAYKTRSYANGPLEKQHERAPTWKFSATDIIQGQAEPTSDGQVQLCICQSLATRLQMVHRSQATTNPTGRQVGKSYELRIGSSRVANPSARKSQAWRIWYCLLRSTSCNAELQGVYVLDGAPTIMDLPSTAGWRKRLI